MSEFFEPIRPHSPAKNSVNYCILNYYTSPAKSGKKTQASNFKTPAISNLTVKTDFTTPAKMSIHPSTSTFSAKMVEKEITKSSTVPRKENNLKTDTSEHLIRAVTPASRVRKENIPLNEPRVKTPAGRVRKEGTTKQNLHGPSCPPSTKTPAGRVKIEKPLPKLITPARKVRMVNLKTNYQTRDIPVVIKSNLQEFPLNFSDSMVPDLSLVSQSERKEPQRFGFKRSSRVNNAASNPSQVAYTRGKDGMNGKRSQENKENEGALNKENEGAPNKENEGALNDEEGVRTPPTIHKPYIRPHTVRAAHRTIFTQNEDYKAEKNGLIGWRKALTFADEDGDDAGGDGGGDEDGDDGIGCFLPRPASGNDADDVVSGDEGDDKADNDSDDSG